MDLGAVGKEVTKGIQETAQSHSPEEEVEPEDTSKGAIVSAESSAEGERARGQRKRVKPRWMKEFVRMEMS